MVVISFCNIIFVNILFDQCWVLDVPAIVFLSYRFVSVYFWFVAHAYALSYPLSHCIMLALVNDRTLVALDCEWLPWNWTLSCLWQMRAHRRVKVPLKCDKKCHFHTSLPIPTHPHPSPPIPTQPPICTHTTQPPTQKYRVFSKVPEPYDENTPKT